MQKNLTQIDAKLAALVILMSLSIVVLSTQDVSAEKIHCSENVDVKKYPICMYETEWNESEKFNEKVIDELSKYTQEINDDPSRFSEIYTEVYNKVDRENEGLQEKGKALKKWIYEQLEK